jgi:hypothetical protein
MGFNLHILLQQLIDYQPSLAETVDPTKKRRPTHPRVYGTANTSESSRQWEQDQHHGSSRNRRSKEFWYRRAFHFFRLRCARVEIVWPCQEGLLNNHNHNHKSSNNSTSSDTSDDLIAIYFPIHPICVCVTATTKESLLQDVTREADKLAEFYAKSQIVMEEMQHQCCVRQHRLFAHVAQRMSQLKMISFIWSVALNIVVFWLLSQYDDDMMHHARPYDSTYFFIGWVPLIMGYVQVSLCLLLLILYLVNDAPLILRRHINDTQHTAYDHHHPLRRHHYHHHYHHPTDYPFQDISTACTVEVPPSSSRSRSSSQSPTTNHHRYRS